MHLPLVGFLCSCLGFLDAAKIGPWIRYHDAREDATSWLVPLLLIYLARMEFLRWTGLYLQWMSVGKSLFSKATVARKKVLACQATIGTFESRVFFWPHYLVWHIMFCFYYNNNWHSSADGKEACLWCTRPGFDPRRVHFIIFFMLLCRFHAMLPHMPSIQPQRLTTGCTASQI